MKRTQEEEYCLGEIRSKPDIELLDITYKPEELPNEITLLTRLKTLSIYQSLLYTLPTWFSTLTTLKDLTFRENKKLRYDSVLLPENVKTLDVFGENSLPSLSHMTVLTCLSIVNHSEQCQSPLLLPPNLENVHLISPGFGALHTNVFLGLKNLTRLSLGSNTKPFTMPSSITCLENLTNLALDRCQIASLPDELGSLTSLKTIIISVCELAALPSTLSKLSQLETIDISNNKLTSLSTVGWHNLKKLDASYNHLSSLPDNLCNLDALEEISLSCNLLGASLRDKHLHLPSLTCLSLIKNELTQLPVLSHETCRLRHINISRNKLSHMPYSFIGPSLASLHYLNTSYNEKSLDYTLLDLRHASNLIHLSSSHWPILSGSEMRDLFWEIYNAKKFCVLLLFLIKNRADPSFSLVLRAFLEPLVPHLPCFFLYNK
jgi:Leucine-rich repeat (LRR) protein